MQRILSEVQEGTNQAVLATEQGTQAVATGMSLATRTGEVIGLLAETIRETAGAAAQIAASAREQSTGMEQIATAMREVGDMTSRFISGARRTQDATDQLRELSERLRTATEAHRVGDAPAIGTGETRVNVMYPSISSGGSGSSNQTMP